MKADRAQFFAENMDRFSRRDRVFLNNPVMMQGLGLAPIVIPSYNIQNAFIMAVAVILMLTPTRMLATFIGQRTGHKFRAVIYAVTAGLVYIGTAYIIDVLFGTAARSVGIYLPLLVLEPLIIKRYESPKSERLSTSLRKGIITTAGFILVLFLVAATREILAQGTLGGVLVLRMAVLPMAAMPAGGFIVLGLLAALWRGLVNTFKKRISMEVKKQR